ncbi:MAG: GxxExxY protein [Acidobacteria bacterium]|nr:GxxExxY protein [Acidobacteriota bacterium]
MESNQAKIELLHAALTDQIIKAFYNVYNSLGYGFLEKVYENALALELREMGLSVECQKPLNVSYRNQIVGEYFADLVVEGKVIIELKAMETIHEAHLRQLQNYLKATEIEVGLLLNFGRKPEFKRRVFQKPLKE